MAWRDKSKRGPILIVEDDWDILEVLRLMLEDEGHAVVTAKHGREALAVANARAFDAVLMDISMPEMSGIEVAKALRANEKTRNIRIAIHTGLDEAWVRERFSDYDLFLTKAADTDVLVEKMAALMATRRGADKPEADSGETPPTGGGGGSTVSGNDNEISFTVDDAVRAKRALCAAASKAADTLSAAEFLCWIEADAEQLRRQGMTPPDIAALIGRAIDRPFPASWLESRVTA